ncbi:MAG: hypothetical protein GXP54_02975 [Deltaproteobacteria bacterium]|nr:hypothetical protein [Deltaproteobacteria bacterium]
MEIYIIVGVAGLVVLWLLAKRGPSPYAAAKKAAEIDSIQPIVQAAGPLQPRARSAFYDQAISTLWEGWQRQLAILMVKEYTTSHSEEKVCQFWLQRALEVEPAVAKEVFDDRFLEEYFRPEVAKACHSGSS